MSEVGVLSVEPPRRDAEPHHPAEPQRGAAVRSDQQPDGLLPSGGSTASTPAPAQGRSRPATSDNPWSRLVLGIDTSTDVRVGLADGSGVLATAAVTATRMHAEQLMPLVVATLADAGRKLADLGLIVVGVGPGPFTGLRVGVATAHALGLALGVAVRGVCSLDVVAAAQVASSHPVGDFLAVSDARRREVYWARYAADGTRVAGPFVTAATALPSLPVAGPGAHLAGGVGSELDGGVLAWRGPQLPDAGLSPLYLRRPDAAVPTTRKSTLLQPRLARLDRP